MSDNRPVLTIAIPTYNRCEKLKELIYCIEKQTCSDAIEVLVSDNCSSDGTYEMMKVIEKDFDNLTYYRNQTNVGADRNFLLCYEHAKGNYVWLVGDDDLVMDGAIESIVEQLESNPDGLFLNSSVLLKRKPVITTKKIGCYGQLSFENLDEFVAAIGINLTFVSSMILRTNNVRDCRDKERYIDTLFIQSHVALMSMPFKGHYIINDFNCIAANANKTINYDLYKIWGKNYYELLFITAANCGVSSTTLENVYHESLNRYISAFIMRFRMTCVNEHSWDKESFIEYACHFEDLKDKLFYILYCSKWKLLLLRIKRILNHGL